MTGSSIFEGAPIIHSYTRAQALADGELVDMTDWARETGFTIPVAITRAAWEDLIAWPDDEPEMQDERGRAHDVLWMLWCAIRRSPSTTDRVDYELYRVPRGSTTGVAELVQLYAMCGPGDNAEPVITIMLPGES